MVLERATCCVHGGLVATEQKP